MWVDYMHALEINVLLTTLINLMVSQNFSSFAPFNQFLIWKQSDNIHDHDSVECRFGRTLDCFPIFSTCIQTFVDIIAFTTAVVKHSKSSETF